MNSGTIQLSEKKRQRRWFAETRVPDSLTPRRDSSVTSTQCQKYMLWIDGVGAWQLLVGDSFVVGAPSFESQSADIAMVANVSRKHATIGRSADVWRLTAHHPAEVSGRTIADTGVLRSGDQICLADRVRLGFRIPSALSTTAVIDFESDHRPDHSVDGIILMADHCLLGPRRDHHVYCSHWPDFVVVFCQGGILKCRSKAALAIDGKAICDAGDLDHGSVVTGDEFRFRVERMQ